MKMYLLLLVLNLSLSTNTILHAQDATRYLGVPKEVFPADLFKKLLTYLPTKDVISMKYLCKADYTLARMELDKREKHYFEQFIGSDWDKKKYFESFRWSKYGPGEFLMGEPGNTTDAVLHKVKIKEAFELSDDITQEQFIIAMGYHNSVFPVETEHCGIINGVHQGPSIFNLNDGRSVPYCPGWPVTNVSLVELKKFVQFLNSTNKAYIYDLPFEEEDEYAAKGGHLGMRYDDKGNLLHNGQYGRPDIKIGEVTALSRVGADLDEGPGRVDQLAPFLNLDGARNLLGLIRKWTRSPWVKNKGTADVDFIRSLEIKTQGVGGEWKFGDEKKRVAVFIFRGALWYSPPADSWASNRYSGNALDQYYFLGARLLRTKKATERN